MKFISFLVALLFSLNVVANDVSRDSLESIINDYHYTITVEWDQENKEFQQKAHKEFIEKLESFFKSNDISSEEVLKSISLNVKDKALLDSMLLKASLVDMSSSPQELMSFIENSSTSFYSRGASWNGWVIYQVAVYSILIIGFTTLCVLAATKKETVCTGTTYWFNDYGNSCDPVFSNGNCWASCFN